MTANQIAWWNIQEQIRSHMQNELNTRNQNSITQSLGNEQNRISNQKMKNDFILGQQGNQINQQQADTAALRATQDYDIGKRTVANQTTRNAQDYEIGTISNRNKAREISNQYVLGSVANQNQSIRNAQDFAIGNKQQATNVRLADAAMLSAGAQIGKLNPAGVVVALTAPYMQQGVNAGAKKVTEVVKKVSTVLNTPAVPKDTSTVRLRGGQVVKVSKPNAQVTPKAPPKPSTPKVVKKSAPILKGRPH